MRHLTLFYSKVSRCLCVSYLDHTCQCGRPSGCLLGSSRLNFASGSGGLGNRRKPLCAQGLQGLRVCSSVFCFRGAGRLRRYVPGISFSDQPQLGPHSPQSLAQEPLVCPWSGHFLSCLRCGSAECPPDSATLLNSPVYSCGAS